MANFSDLDAYAEALKKIDFDDVVMPYKNGRLVENVEIYNKVQKLLDCPELETAHQFLYDVDCDEISEEECEKIDKLYSLATERGFIEKFGIDGITWKEVIHNLTKLQSNACEILAAVDTIDETSDNYIDGSYVYDVQYDAGAIIFYCSDDDKKLLHGLMSK